MSTTTTASEPISESTSVIWYGPEAGETKCGPGDSPNDPRADYPWDVLRFRKGFLTLDKTSEHFPEWTRWLVMMAPGCPGLRVITQAERDRIEHIDTDAEWLALEARHAAAVARRG